MDLPLTQHPLSAAFPAMSLADLAALTDDIASHGLRQAIVMLDGQVLDGWHRYQACIAARETPRFVDFEGDDPRDFVLSLNLSRRHLTASQRAAAAVACSEWRRPGHQSTNSKGEPGSPPSMSNAELAKQAETTTRTIQQAKRAHEAGLGDAVRDGKVSAKRAEQVSRLPLEERAAALEAGPPTQRALDSAQEHEADERAADLATDFEAAMAIIDADDKLAAAWVELKKEQAAHEVTRKLYEAQRAELATMTREAKRWMRKAQALEKGVKS